MGDFFSAVRLLSELRNGSSSLNGDDELTENLRADSMATTAAISSRCTSQDNVFGSVHNNSGGGDELVDEKEKEEEGDNDGEGWVVWKFLHCQCIRYNMSIT